ncbi:hypothetical protein [Iningainema tapete]|uniref:Uncharacterized protein n=1 Tax=Iningainema tapete BLCC-T55 TaxID=2748662 RepID=A0A8J6XI66_9CYAN|nr:hypothetical protein [Iningainema tapete]MBD2771171.1 hypothetical protein [Iningainema tapete BLCC-T55]
MTQTAIDSQQIAQIELAQYLEQQAQELAPEFEIDGLPDEDFGTLYRLWKGRKLLGTFYKALDEKWIAQPMNNELKARLDTDTQAILAIIALNGMLVANSAA